MRYVEVCAQCKVNGRVLSVRKTFPEDVWEDEQARESIEKAVRTELMIEAAEQFKPKVTVRPMYTTF